TDDLASTSCTCEGSGSAATIGQQTRTIGKNEVRCGEIAVEVSERDFFVCCVRNGRGRAYAGYGQAGCRCTTGERHLNDIGSSEVTDNSLVSEGRVVEADHVVAVATEDGGRNGLAGGVQGNGIVAIVTV